MSAVKSSTHRSHHGQAARSPAEAQERASDGRTDAAGRAEDKRRPFPYLVIVHPLPSGCIGGEVKPKRRKGIASLPVPAGRNPLSKPPSRDDRHIFLAVIGTASLGGATARAGASDNALTERGSNDDDRRAASSRRRRPTPSHRRRGPWPMRQARSVATPSAGAERVVRLDVSEFIGVEVIPPLPARLRRNHPELAVDLALGSAPSEAPAQKVDIALRHPEPSPVAMVARLAARPARALCRARLARATGASGDPRQFRPGTT